VHGCLTVMQRKLETHVTIILIVFGVRGSHLLFSSLHFFVSPGIKTVWFAKYT
jgi:hypothetical protein